MSESRRVVVTGIGIVSALGCGREAVWKSFISNQTGIDRLSIEGLPSPICWAGEVKNFEARDYIAPKKKKYLKVMSRDIQLAVVASKFAIEESGLNQEGVNRERTGLSIAASLIDNDLDEMGASFKAASENGHLIESRFGSDGRNALTPLWMLKYLPNMPACHISLLYDLQGPSNTITTEGAGGLQAIGEGFRIIERGDADCMVVGGVDSKLNAIGLSKYALLDVFPKAEGETPRELFRPFDDEVSGLLPGEAAAILVIEEREHALKRRAPHYGEILGFGTAPLYDYTPQKAVDTEGRLLSMRKALKDAKIKVEELNLLVANGNGIPAQDNAEARAIQELIQDSNAKLPIAAFKPQTGYTASASGALETVLAVLSLKHGKLGPIYGMNGVKKNDLNFVRQEINWDCSQANRALIHASSLVGQSSSLVIKSGGNS